MGAPRGPRLGGGAPCPGGLRDGRDRWLAQAELGVTDLAVLTVMRFFVQSFAEPASQGWMGAFATAREAEGRGEGGAGLALAVLGAVQAVRVARVSAFRFSNPACPGCAAVLCEHERLFVGAFRALRLGRRGEATAHALLLCEGGDARPFLAALERLAALAREG